MVFISNLCNLEQSFPPPYSHSPNDFSRDQRQSLYKIVHNLDFSDGTQGVWLVLLSPVVPVNRNSKDWIQIKHVLLEYSIGHSDNLRLHSPHNAGGPTISKANIHHMDKEETMDHSALKVVSPLQSEFIWECYLGILGITCAPIIFHLMVLAWIISLRDTKWWFSNSNYSHIY